MLVAALRTFVLACLVALPCSAVTWAQELPDPALFDRIVVEAKVVGLVSQPEEVILRALGVKIGAPAPDMRSERRIESVFQSYGVFVDGEPKVKSVPGGLSITFHVKEFEVDLEPGFLGNETYSVKRLKEWAGLTGRSDLYLYEADGIVHKLTEGYRQQGFHFVEIEWLAGGRSEDGRHQEVIFLVREGPKVRCRGVEIVGNTSLPAQGVLFWKSGLRNEARLKTKGPGLFSWFGGVFEEETLQSDLIAMREVYRNRGFLDAKVEIERLDFNDKRNRVRVHVRVDEGPLYKVASLKVRAVDRSDATVGWNDVSASDLKTVDLIIPADELLAKTELKPGAAFEQARLNHDRGEISRAYGARGYLEAGLFLNSSESNGFRFLTPKVLYDVEKAEVHVTYEIVQGRQLFIHSVELLGNLHTRDRVARREISMLPGELADLDKLHDSLARLRGSGYYSDRQDPSHPEATFQLRTVPGEPDQVAVDFIVEEGRVVDFQLSGGVASDNGVVGLMSLTMRNFDSTKLPRSFGSTFGEIYSKDAFHGNGESLSLNVSPGSEVSFWSASYQHPDLFGRHFDRWGGGFEALNRDRIFSSHDEDRTRVRLDTSRYFGQGDLAIRTGPVIQRIEYTDLSATFALPATLTLAPLHSDFHGWEFFLTWSRLDNRQIPRDGFYTDLRTTYYGGPLGGDNDLVKTEFNLEVFQPIGEDLGDARPGWYTSFGAGWAVPFGDSNLVHYGERFFLGGSVDLRGFEFRGVGPNDGDFSSGGEGMLKGSFEYRYPIYTTAIPGTSRRQEVLRISPFVDWGVLSVNHDNLSFSQLRSSAGVTFSLVNPIPISFSFGWPIDQGIGDRTEVFSFRLSLR
tara:strand:- start:515 stop:3079 length:2565 start_codon:yes stop_codon:yes gene_type:complete